ncbi:translocation/assembly module TamB [Draconibacterium sp.]|nr:translocation/assembly module TamB [Draconibacterium sp.]
MALLIVLLVGIGLSIRTSYIQTIITKKLTEQLSERTNTNISIGRVNIGFFNKIVLNNILIEAQNRDTLFYTEKALASIDMLKIRKRRISFSEILFDSNKINIVRDSLNHFNFIFLLDSMKTQKDISIYWNINCNQFGFQQSSLSYQDERSENKKNIFLNDLNLNLSGFYNNKDSVQLNINSLDFNDGKKLFLEQLSATILINKDKIFVKALNMKSKNSYVEDSEVIIPFSNDSTIGAKPEIDFNLKHSEISFLELAEIIPSLRGMNQKIQLSGRIQGNMSYLKGKNIELKTGRRTKAELDFYINDILDIETMYLFFDLRELTSTFSDISRIRLPYKAKINYIKFPESFYENDFLSYTGNFSGFLSDFVSFGTLKSELGILNTDVSVIPKENETVQFRGSISTVDFKLGELLRNSRLGKITFQGEVDGNYYYEESDIAGIFKGNADNFEINDYTYKNIQLDGLYMDEMFDGLLSIDDPNINFDFQGQFDLNERSPEFNFNLKLNRFQPGKLNLSTTFPNSEMAFNMRAKFTGNKIDNLKGLIIVDDGKYQNKNGQFSLNNMQLISVPNDSTNTLTFNSDFVDIGIEGNYDFQSIIHSFRKVANHFLPAIKYDEKKLIRPNSFDYEIDVKDINQLAETFYPGLKFETPFLLYGKIDSEKPDFELAGSIPGIQYNNIWVRNVFIGNKTVNEKYSSIFKFGEVLHRNGMEIYDFTVDSKIAENKVKNIITWRNSLDSTIQSTIESQTIFLVPDSSNSTKILTDFFPTTIFIADSSWQFSPFTIKLDSSSIYVEDFNIFRGNQNLSIDGNVTKKDSNHLAVNFNDINLGYLTKSFGTKKSFAGLVNCSVGISGLYTRPAIVSNITVDSFKFENHLIGDVDLVSHWDQENSVVNSELEIIKNNKKRLKAFGFYNTESGELNYDANADSLSINLLGTVIKNNLSNFEGDATGKVKISGTTDKLALNGALYATDAGLKIDYTQGVYTFNDFVYFKNDTIQFDNITIQDVDKNQGNFNGTIVHNNFNDMIYDMTINSSKIQVLNTTSADNQQFYGNAIANCKLNISGQGKTVALTGSATTLKGTDINISMDYEGEIQQYDFIEFKRPESDVEREQFFAKNLKGNFSIGLTVEATPEAKVQLIYNSRIGDIIKAQGEGILLFEMDKDFNISLSGDYTLTEGDYLFTLQNVLNKRFTIDQGSSIVWSGDPYNANIDLTAIYKLKASLYDLMVENYLIDDIYQRIPVECKILLTEELTNPLINFEIDFPEEDETVTGILQQYINTEEEMNKQILSLIVMGKFYTPEYLRGTYESQNPNTLGTTASEVFSNQLSNWLSQISNDVDVGFNYRPGNSITNDEIELALSTQIFDDRVTLNGNIGNNVNPESTNSSQIVGDFDMKVKIVPSGKIQFKAFNRSNNNLIYDTAPYTQGIGFTFKEEYNSIDELAKKIGSIFKKKK